MDVSRLECFPIVGRQCGEMREVADDDLAFQLSAAAHRAMRECDDILWQTDLRRWFRARGIIDEVVAADYVLRLLLHEAPSDDALVCPVPLGLEPPAQMSLPDRADAAVERFRHVRQPM